MKNDYIKISKFEILFSSLILYKGVFRTQSNMGLFGKIGVTLCILKKKVEG